MMGEPTGPEGLSSEAMAHELRLREISNRRTAAERAGQRSLEEPLSAHDLSLKVIDEGRPELGEALCQAIERETREIEGFDERGEERDKLAKLAGLVYVALQEEARLNEASRGELVGQPQEPESPEEHERAYALKIKRVSNRQAAADKAERDTHAKPLPAHKLKRLIESDDRPKLADVLWEAVEEGLEGVGDFGEIEEERNRLVKLAGLVYVALQEEARLNEAAPRELFSNPQSG